MSEMAEEWIVRVQSKEYGPADIETLREWKTEGRLVAGNEARRADVDLWTTAADIPGLFDAGTLEVGSGDGLTQPPLRRRSFAQILAETFRIYRNGFFQFLSLTLLVVLPSACGQLATAWVQTGSNVNFDLQTLTVGAFAFCMTVLTMVLWPVYIAAIQILTAERLAGRRIGLVAALNEAVKFWPRVAALCIFIYGVFALLTIFALAITVMIVAALDPFRVGFAHPAGLDVRVVLHQCAVLAAVYGSRKRRIHRFTARKQKSRAERSRPSMVPTSVLARSVNCVSLVRVCARSHAHSPVDDPSSLF